MKFQSGCAWLAGNFEFGLSRVLRSLEPLATNVDALKWRGVRACLLMALDSLAKHLVMLKVQRHPQPAACRQNETRYFL